MDISGLIVGLGNPGPKYTATRHNIGFMVLDAVIADAEAKTYRRLTRLPSRDDAEMWTVSLPKVKGDFLLLKPLTYMNLSGKAALRVSMEFGLSPKDALVLHDELDLPLGRMKFKAGGGTAGHNGLKSLVAEWGTDAFTRLRIGIGRPSAEEHMGISDYVLTPFREDEAPVVQAVVAKARDLLPSFFSRGLAAAMQEAHPFDAVKRSSPDAPEAAPKRPGSEKH